MIGPILLTGLLVPAGLLRALEMSYRPLMSGAGGALTASLTSFDPRTGAVTLNGVFTAPSAGAFRIAWGDGSSTTKYFPATHTYVDRTRSFVVTVSATATTGRRFATEVPVRFVDAVMGPWKVAPGLRVEVPTVTPDLRSTQPGMSVPALAAFGGVAMSRSVVEQVLGAIAEVECNLVGGDVVRSEGAFRQVILRQDKLPNGSFSVWYTTPVAVGAGEPALQGSVRWSTLAHEMGHNFTLNMPASFRFGGRTDGWANALYAETLAQVFQHVATFLVVTHAPDYGIPDDLAAEIRQSAYQSFAGLRTNAERLRTGQAKFSAWNDPSTPVDETLPTFMCLAYEFFRQADADGANYRECAQRLCAFLRHFDATWQAGWAQHTDSPAASSFRATLMVAALSHGVGKDLRSVFRLYGFPIDDETYRIVSARGAAPLAPVPADTPAR